MTTTISQEILDGKRNLSLLENALNVHFLWQYKFMKKRLNLKWAYVQSRDEFVRKFRLRYHSITDEEIASFIRIYIMYEPAENDCEQSDLYFEEAYWICRICFLSPYLKEEGDYNYGWMIENNTSEIHFP